MASKEEKYNLKITAIQTGFWLVFLLVAIYFLIVVGGLHWPKILSALYPNLTSLDLEATSEAQVAPPLALPASTPEPTPSASVSAALLNDLLQAILAASSSAPLNPSASPSAAPDPDLPESRLP